MIFLILLVKISTNQKQRYFDFIALGVVLGLLGNTHPNGFATGMAVFSFWAIFFLWKNRNSYSLLKLGATLPGILLSMLYFVPMFLLAHEYGGFISVGRVEELALPLIQIAPFIFLLIAFFYIKRIGYDIFLSSLILLIALFLIITVFKYYSIVEVEWLKPATRVNRYGPYCVLILFFLSAAGLDQIIRLNYGYKLSLALRSILLILFLSGSWVTGNVITKGKLLTNLQSTFTMNSSVRPFAQMIKKYPPSEELLSKTTNSQTVIIAPPHEDVGIERLARYAGICVAYRNRPRVPLKDFYQKTMSQEKRLELLNEFYVTVQGVPFEFADHFPEPS